MMDLTTFSLRPASTVMRLSRMGQSFPHRLSFSRQIIRRMMADDSRVSRPVWQIDAQGHGRAVYSVDVGSHTYSLVAISSPLDDSQRSDRVIAEAWDACFTLFDGVPTVDDLDRLANSQIHQEAARYTANELTLSRANKSMRLFGYVRDCLANGEQPDADRINDIGYLMRTTAVYGNGKFGIADRHDYSDRPGMAAPFQAEMLTVWLIRGFTHDLVEHCAQAMNPNAVALAPDLKRHLGVGNSTGLGMAPFLVHHPELLHQWVWARETALAMALDANDLVPKSLIERARTHLDQWQVDDAQGQARIEKSRVELRTITECSAETLWQSARGLSEHSQELVASLILESTSAEVEALAEQLATDHVASVPMDQSPAVLANKLADQWAWAIDDVSPEKWFWYVSENKLEPRVGQREHEDGSELEKPLTVVRDIKALIQSLEASQAVTLGDFLAKHPELFAVTRRAFAAMDATYSEVQDNLVGEHMRPIDMLRFKLSFFGASKFDPKSDLWTRITLFQGAPTHDAMDEPGDDWWLSTI